MFNNYLQAIEGVEIYPVIGLIIFLVVFTSVVVWVLRLDKNYLREAERIPLDENEADASGKIKGFKNLTGGSHES